MKKILVYGYGNPGRQDDGLGARFIELLDEWISQEGITHIYTDCNYQLNIEDASLISDYDAVIFIDASVVAEVNDFMLEPIVPNNATIEFTMHAVSVGYVVDLCKKMYNRTPEAHVMHIKAYEFDFKEELTEQATANMLAAFEFLKTFLRTEKK